jgi:hypothetical protein
MSPITVHMKSRLMRWVGHVTRTGEVRNAYKILVGKYEGKDFLEDIVLQGRVILK